MPKRTYQPKKRKRRRSGGFLSRMRSDKGRKVIKMRRRKKRAKLSL